MKRVAVAVLAVVLAVIGSLLVLSCTVDSAAPPDMVLAPTEIRVALEEIRGFFSEGFSGADIDAIENALRKDAARASFTHKLPRVVFVDPREGSSIRSGLGIRVVQIGHDLLHISFVRLEATEESWRLVQRLAELVPERYRLRSD